MITECSAICEENVVRNKEKCDIGHPCEKITASWTKFSIAYDVDYWRTETKRQNYTHEGGGRHTTAATSAAESVSFWAGIFDFHIIDVQTK